MAQSRESVQPAIIAKTRYRQSESIISAISVGFVFILLGSVYVLALPSNLLEEVVDFFGSMTLKQVSTSGINLPAPVNPSAHGLFYTAIFQFCVGLAFLQIIILVLRLAWGSPTPKTGETLGSLVFWSGASWLAMTFLNSNTTNGTWFAFWAGILIMMGLSLLTRSIVLLLKR